MDNNQKNLFLSVGAFLMLISGDKFKKIKVENGHYLSYEGNVTDITLVNYLIATMLMDWNTIIIDPQDKSSKTIISCIKNCNKELFSLPLLKKLKTSNPTIIDSFTNDVRSDAPRSLEYMSEFVTKCIDKDKCYKMVSDLLIVIRDDDEIPDDSVFFISGNGTGTTKREMVDKMTEFYADCFLLGVWQYILHERGRSNRNGRETLEAYFPDESEKGKKHTRAEAFRLDNKKLGHKIKVIISKLHKEIAYDVDKYKHPKNSKLFEYDIDALDDEDRNDLDRIKNNRVLHNLIKAAIICPVEDYGMYYREFKMCMARCKSYEFTIKDFDLLQNDLNTLYKILEEFLKAIDPNSNIDKTYRMENAAAKKEKLKTIYNTLYGSRASWADESISSLLSVL